MGVLESNKWTFEFNDNLRDKVDGHFIGIGRSRKFEVNSSKISLYDIKNEIGRSSKQ